MRATPWLLGLALAGCGEPAPDYAGRAWPEADRLFHGDPRWVGGDGAYSVDLGGERVLWLFGDSFIQAPDAPGRARAGSTMVRNSLAVQTGTDPSTALLAYFWREHEGTPRSFFAEDGSDWFWPAHGVVVDGRLVIFLQRVFQEGEGTWGFAGRGWRAVRVDEPWRDPSEWELVECSLPDGGRGVQLGTAVLDTGADLIAFGERGAAHEVVAARWTRDELFACALEAPRWWDGAAFTRGAAPAVILDVGAPEFSLHRDPASGRYLFVHTAGFGGATLALRAARHATGPFSEPRDVYRPPESFVEGALVYAGKAHPALTGASLVATYVPSAFEGGPPVIEEASYYPRFVRLEPR